MAVITPQRLIDLNTTISANFQKGMDSYKPTWQKYARLIKSSNRQNTYPWLGQFPQPAVVTPGTQVPRFNMQQLQYTLMNVLYNDIVNIANIDIEDDLVNAEQVGQNAAIGAMQFLDINSANLILNGTSNLCYDGQPFFDVDHPVYPNADGTGTPVSTANILNPSVTTGEPWVLLSDATMFPFLVQERQAPMFVPQTAPNQYNPFEFNNYSYKLSWRGAYGYGLWQTAILCRDALTPDNYEAARSMLRAMKWDGGTNMSLAPTKLLVGASNEGAGKQILNGQQLVGSGTNIWYGTAELIVNNYLTIA